MWFGHIYYRNPLWKISFLYSGCSGIKKAAHLPPDVQGEKLHQKLIISNAIPNTQR